MEGFRQRRIDRGRQRIQRSEPKRSEDRLEVTTATKWQLSGQRSERTGFNDFNEQSVSTISTELL